jgi:hypothetical protein
MTRREAGSSGEPLPCAGENGREPRQGSGAPHNNSMQRTALCAAADAGRYVAQTQNTWRFNEAKELLY